MSENIPIGLASILILGIAAQWLAWRLRLPSILLMLLFGIIAGPATGFLNPDEIFCDLLLPIVSLSVAVILFEGGLSLKIAELREVGTVIRRLITVGAIVTWGIGASAAHLILGLDWNIAALLGAILIVTGPTVILPLLRHIRPFGQVSSILRWEGIVIDPVGAMLAVLVFEAILVGQAEEASTLIALGIIKTLFVGGIAGAIAAGFIILLLKRYWIPDFLQSPAALMVVVAVSVVSNLFQEESGLLAATVMGIVLANQKRVSIQHIIEFKENLGVLLVSVLFILLSARLQLSELENLSLTTLAFLGVLVLIARPAAVLVSTFKSGLSWRERSFLLWMAPRGIVAAAVASVFALRLAEAGHPQAEDIVPITFAVILGTVAVYGLTARPLAYRLQVAKPNPQGFLIVGAHSWAREIGHALQEKGFHVVMVDTNWLNLSAARKMGLSTFYASILSQYALDEIELSGVGRLLALTPNDGINSLATLHFAPVLGRENIYQLTPEGEESGRKEVVSQHLRGRLLFGPEITYSYLTDRFREGAVIKATGLTEKFDFDEFMGLYSESAIPLFLIDKDGDLAVAATDSKPAPRPGHTLISLVDPAKEDEPDGSQASGKRGDRN